MQKGFLSLKWQAVLGVSFILTFGIGLITYFGKKNLEQTYVNQRDRVFQDRRQAITGALQSMQLQLLQLASHMQGLASHTQGQKALDNSGQEAQTALRETLERNWDQLNFEWGIDAVALYDTRGEAYAHWFSQESALPARGVVPAPWVARASRQETPVTEIWCAHSCWQVVIVPVLLEGLNVGMLSFVRSLADALLQFQNSTAADVGILIPHTGISSAGAPTRPFKTVRTLKHWQHDVVALTRAEVTFSMLDQLSDSLPMAELQSHRALQAWQDNHYEISLIPLAHAGAKLVVIDNVVKDLKRLQSTLTNFILAAIAILVLAEGVLLWLLWLPMVRLQVVAKALPMLAHKSRGRLDSTLDRAMAPRFLRNEIHVLFEAASLLSRTLEKLDATVKSRTQRLKNRSRELLEQRNFVTTLLNTVHVVILTQDRDGTIHLLNSEGRRLTGISKKKCRQLRFTDCVATQHREEVRRGIEGLFSGRSQQFHQESLFIGADGEQLHMDWYHSLLPASNAGANLVLSVGLDLTARKIAEQNLAWLADHDPLTELYNRRHFQHQFQQALKKFSRSKQPGALIFFDVDQFKTINDTIGHPAGDRLLCELAAKLNSEIRDTDTLARLGGDEFAILLEQTDRNGTITFARKLCEMVNETSIIGNNTPYRVTISLGIALFPEHGESVEELMANADFAMYKAKAKGNARSNWHIYSADAPEKHELQHRLDWKARIEDALDNNRLLLYYQPILDIAHNRLSHYEALVRMRGENGEIAPPCMFIPVAEKTGLIHEIDSRVLKLAIADLHKFCHQGRDITLSVNLSAKAIAKNQFVETIENLVDEFQVERSRLILELTETSAVEDIFTAADVIARCRKLGYKFALDDFGVGFASWFYLRQLPVDFVKIDGSFVRNLTASEEDRLFIKALNDVAQGLGKETIAEFVENASVLKLLSEFGVNYAQGYYIGKPAPELLPENSYIPTFPRSGPRPNIPLQYQTGRQ